MKDYFKSITKSNSCTTGGACSIHPSVNALYRLILAQIKETSFYLVKLNEFNISDKNIISTSILALSTFLINTNFNKTKYLNFYNQLDGQRKEIKQKYLCYCKDNDLPYETINSNLPNDDNISLEMLIKHSLTNIVNKQQNKEDNDKFNLFELITIFAKLAAINIEKIKSFDNDYDAYDFETIRFFALTNSYSIKKEKLIRRIKDFSLVARKIKDKLNSIYLKNFGLKQDASISFEIQKGHNILVSGSDLNELEKLLKTIENYKNNENINVYTNGSLLLAHFYPYFKDNKFLKGHFEKGNPEYDLATFKGTILLTKNFIQKIDSLYKGEIFSNKLISFDKVIDIKNYDYMPLIELTSTIENEENQNVNKKIEIKYCKEDILNQIKNYKENKIIIVLSEDYNKTIIETYQDKKILNIPYPYLEDILNEAVEMLVNKNIEVEIFFLQCTIISLCSILSMLSYDIKFNIPMCPNSLINPHIFEALENDFKVSML